MRTFPLGRIDTRYPIAVPPEIPNRMVGARPAAPAAQAVTAAAATTAGSSAGLAIESA
jgi:hypothetical protein